MKKKFLFKIFLISLIFIGLLGFGLKSIAQSQFGGPFETIVEYLFYVKDGGVFPSNSVWELGSSTVRIAKGWFTDLDTTNMTIGGVSSGDLNMDSHIITNIGNTGTDFIASTGALVLAGDLTISGDDLYMNTNTLGAVLVGDDTNFNPVVLSGDASIAADGTMTVADLTCSDCINATEIEDIYLFNNAADVLTASVDTSTLLTLQNTDTTITTAGYLLKLIHNANDDLDAGFISCQDDGAGTPTNLFTIGSDGEITTPDIETGQPNILFKGPISVDVGGDVGISYDLAFLGTGTSYITSEGPLAISSGDPNHPEHLTLTTRSNEAVGENGVASAGTATTLTDSTKAWTTNQWKNGTVSIVSGTGKGQVRTVSSNTATVITVPTWTVNPDTTSVYHLAYAKGGDVLVNVQNADLVYGGFKVLGMDGGGYVMHVSPDGDVAIGGSGSGGSDLTVKQNITLTGGDITINKLATPTGLAVSQEGTTGSTTYGYRVSAVNDNGQTLACSTVQITDGNATLDTTNYIQVRWTAVSGATSYKIYGRTSGSELYMKTVATLDTIWNDTGSITPSGALPTTNTTGGNITTSDLTCTDCLNATEIEDIYLFNTGDTGTGVYDFGGATSLEIPNGTDLPATCSIGQIFQDTDSNDCVDTAAGDGALCICKSANTWALITNF